MNLLFFFSLLLQSSISDDTHLGFFLLLWLRQRPLGKTVGARVLRETPAGLDETCSHLQTEPTHAREDFFFSFLFLFPASFAGSFSTLPVCVFHLHLPLFIGSETKAPALVVVLAAVRSASRGKSFSLHSSSLHRRVRSFIPKMLMGSHIAVDLWREALQCLITKHPAPWWIAVIPTRGIIPQKTVHPAWTRHSFHPSNCNWTSKGTAGIQEFILMSVEWYPGPFSIQTVESYFENRTIKKKPCWKARWRLLIKFRIRILK